MRPEPYYRSVAIKFLLFFAPSALLLSAILLGVYHMVTLRAERGLEDKEKQAARLCEDALVSDFEYILSDLVFLSGLPSAKLFLKTKSEEHREQLEEVLVKFLIARRMYDQIRILDRNGMEILNARFKDGRAMISDPRELQFKGARDYFQDARDLKPGEIMISRFELNTEYGVIEKPFKPVIRFMAHIGPGAGDDFGLIIAHYLGQRLIRDLNIAASSSVGQVSLLDNRGYWLAGHEKERLWAFMFAQGKEVRFGEEFPREWRTISRTESGQFRTDNGLFTFTTVRPLRQALERILGGRAEDINLKKKIKNSNYYWKLVSRASNYVFRSRSEQLFEDFGSILIIVISMAGLGSFFLALTQERRNRAEAAREQLLINLTKATQELDYKAAHDSLTGVLNRSAILDKLNAEIARSQRSDEPLGVILADVDHFKSINDKHGHLAGDKVLSHIAERISDSLRDYDFVGRYGGEEFIIIVPGCNQERTLNLAERLRESFEFEDLDTSEGRFHLTLSFGVTSITGAERSITMDGIIRAADEALYKAKREGRNSVEYNPVYEPNAA